MPSSIPCGRDFHRWLLNLEFTFLEILGSVDLGASMPNACNEALSRGQMGADQRVESLACCEKKCLFRCFLAVSASVLVERSLWLHG